MTTPQASLEERLRELCNLPGDTLSSADWIEQFIKASREAADTIAGLRKALEAANRAIGTHNAPADCYSTGPYTGDPISDYVQCPACLYLAARAALRDGGKG